MVTRSFQKPTIGKELSTCWRTCRTAVSDFFIFWISFIWNTYISLIIATEKRSTSCDDLATIERKQFSNVENIIEEEEEEDEPEVVLIENENENKNDNIDALKSNQNDLASQEINVEIIENDVVIDMKEEVASDELDNEPPWTGTGGSLTRYAGLQNLQAASSSKYSEKLLQVDKSVPTHQEKFVSPNVQPVLLSRKVGSPLILTPKRGLSIDDETDDIRNETTDDKAPAEDNTDNLWEELVKKYATESVEETKVIEIDSIKNKEKP